LRLGKHHSEAAVGTIASVSNKTDHQSGKGTAAVQTARARYALVHPQEWLRPFAKEGWTLLGLRVALVRTSTTVETGQTDRRTVTRVSVAWRRHAGLQERAAGRAALRSAKL
jgi:hypothetical protein